MTQAQVKLEKKRDRSKDSYISWGREKSAKNLNLYQQVLWVILRIEAGWLPGLVPWAWKQRIGDFTWRDAQQIQSLRARLLELRYPLKRFEKDLRVQSLAMEA